MTSSFLVRPAREADLPAVQVLLRQLDELHAKLQPGFFQPPVGQARPARVLQRLLEGRDEVLLVAQAAPATDASLLGLVCARIYQTPPDAGMTQRRRAHIESLVVDPRQRRRGCGRLLLEHATRWARAQDAAQVVLTVWAGNAEADAFYQRLGYQPVSTVLSIDLG